MLRCQTCVPSCDLQAHQIAILAEDIDTIAVDGRRAARSRTAIVVARAADRLRPEVLAVCPVHDRDDAVAIHQSLNEHAIAGDGQ